MKKKLRSEFVTRQNMIRDNFEIYYYSDSYFQNVLPHTHDYYEFYFPVSGEIAMEISDTCTPLSHRDVVIVPPGTLHRARTSSEKSYCRYILWISKKYYEQIKAYIGGCYIVEQVHAKNHYVRHFSESEYALIQSRLLRLLEEDQAMRPMRESFLMMCVSDILLTLSRMAYEHDHPAEQGETESLFRQVADYIEQNLEEDLSLRTLEERFFVSKYHIAHLFKERTGISVHQYILKKRLERIASAIVAGQPIAEVYGEYGFSDYSSFYRAFKKEYRISPREYRAVHLFDPLRTSKRQ